MDTGLCDRRYVYASEADLPLITCLWKEAFGDDTDYINGYFDRWFDDKRIILIKEKDRIVSMASLFCVDMDGRRAVYVFALATDMKDRGRGAATDLLRHIQDEYRCPVILQPEKTGVEDFYRKIGFETLDKEHFWDICLKAGIEELTLGKDDAMIRETADTYEKECEKFIFKDIVPEKMDEFIGFFGLRPNRSCDSMPLSLYLYRHLYEPDYCIDGRACLVIFLQDEINDKGEKERKTIGSIPYCREEDLVHYFKVQEKYFNNVLNKPHLLFSADEEGVAALMEAGALDNYTVTEDVDLKDYLYSGESMRTLAGKKLSKKRNLIHQFEKAYEGRWEYCSINADDREEVLTFLEAWKNEHGSGGGNEEVLEAELKGIRDLFSHPVLFAKFKFGGIRIDGELRAFSIGAYNPSEKMAIIDVEKAEKDINGLYQIINREFLVHEFPEAEIVNREDDVGEENLRKAKMSYMPIGFERKFTLRQKDFKAAP